MKSKVKVSLLSLVLGCAFSTVGAAELLNVPSPGAIRGRIVDEELQTLPGAAIYIESLHIGVVSDINGFYTIPSLKPGTYKVQVSYIGYAPYEIELTVKPTGETVVADLVLLDGSQQLEEVVVQGAFSGQRRAINVQKNGLGITNVVSADQVGKFPDSNIGDALKRISGINVQYDQGEARFGQIRGTSADLSSVTINGNRVPSAEGETRNVQLDLIPSDMVQTIEVNKVVTPDMDADAIGGSVNLITKSSPYKRTIAATAGTGYSWISDKAQLNLGMTYGDNFFDNKLGVMLSASYQNNPGGSDDAEFEWEKDEDGNVYLKDYQVRQYYVTRERQSYSAALDWNIHPNHKINFKGIFNNRNDWENRYRKQYKYDKKSGNYDVIYQTKGGSSDIRDARLERQRTMDYTLGGDHLLGKLAFDWKASYAKATEKRPDERYIGYKKKAVPFNSNLSDERYPMMVPADGEGAVSLNPDNGFNLGELTQSQQDIKEEDLKFNANFSLPMIQGLFGNKLSFGAKVVAKSKKKDTKFYDYEPKDENTFSGQSFANLSDQTRNGYMAGDYKAGSFVTKEYLGGLDLDNGSLFSKERNIEEEAGNYKANETVTSGYLRFDQRLGEKWNLMAGLRLENTHVKYSGYRFIEEDEDQNIDASFIPTGNYTQSYLNVLPAFLVKYDVNDDLKVRASFTNTLARPKYANLIPNVTIKTSDNEIKMGNPDLKATLSYNLDLSVDYYFKSIGLMSAGVFYKKIHDFVVDERTSNYIYNGQTYDQLTQPKNVGDANLLGLELGFQRDFGFIAPALRCIGFYSNYTYTYSRVDNFNIEGRENENDLRLPGSPEHTANASLYFEKNGLNLRLSYNFASAFIDEVGENKFYDRYYDKVNYMDVNVSYTFGSHYTVYAEATNLLNQPLRYYQGTSDRTMQAEYYGVKVAAGFKINF